MNPTISIIGGGPAGLAIAGRLTKAGVPCIIYEKSEHVGHAWHNHYDRLHLHTVKEYSHLPHLPFPADYPQYASRQQFVDYLHYYAAQFSLNIKKGHHAHRLQPLRDKWQFEIESTKEKIKSDIVIVATGYNNFPVIPEWSGKDEYQGRIVHSKTYKNPQPFTGQKVLVVGMGNTGAEIALDLANHGIEVSISVRGPVNIVPRDFKGRPTQKTAMMLRQLPVWLGDQIGIVLRKIAIGDLSKYGIDTPKEPPAAQLRKYGKTPVIDIGTVNLIKAGKINVLSDINRLTTDKVVFDNAIEKGFDIIILATGYKANLDQWVKIDSSCFNDKGAARKAYFNQYPGIYFLGFDTSFSGILNAIYEQSEDISDHIIKSLIASKA